MTMADEEATVPAPEQPAPEAEPQEQPAPAEQPAPEPEPQPEQPAPEPAPAPAPAPSPEEVKTDEEAREIAAKVAENAEPAPLPVVQESGMTAEHYAQLDGASRERFRKDNPREYNKMLYNTKI